VEIVESRFVPNPQGRQSEAGKPDRQADNANQSLAFVFPQIAESYCKIMF
jgi:hypothetical protein